MSRQRQPEFRRSPPPASLLRPRGQGGVIPEMAYAEDCLLQQQNKRIAELEQERDRLWEYFNAREALDTVGLFRASPHEIKRVNAAREALLARREQ